MRVNIRPWVAIDSECLNNGIGVIDASDAHRTGRILGSAANKRKAAKNLTQAGEHRNCDALHGWVFTIEKVPLFNLHCSVVMLQFLSKMLRKRMMAISLRLYSFMPAL